MELPLKVHSHMRSGTHLLMATLALNFEFGDASIEVEVPGQRWHATGQSRAIVPWGGLFGDHEPFSENRLEVGRILYAVRDPRDTLHSLWRFQAPTVPLDEFLTPDRIRYWYQHASGYCRSVPWVRFEDLTCDRFAEVMSGIARRFGLRRRAPEPGAAEGPGCFRPVQGPVGWSPGSGRGGQWRSWPAELQERFTVVIPDGFLGYELAEHPMDGLDPRAASLATKCRDRPNT